jgi:hypothetical protein
MKEQDAGVAVLGAGGLVLRELPAEIRERQEQHAIELPRRLLSSESRPSGQLVRKGFVAFKPSAELVECLQPGDEPVPTGAS